MRDNGTAADLLGQSTASADRSVDDVTIGTLAAGRDMIIGVDGQIGTRHGRLVGWLPGRGRHIARLPYGEIQSNIIN